MSDQVYPLNDLLQRGLPKPANLQDAPDGCGLIVLACHCFMVHDGFNTLNSSIDDGPQSAYHLPDDWNTSEHQDYWALRYSKEGFKHEFLLEVSLRRATGQILVSASEVRPAGQDSNVQRLGLQLAHYVPDASVLKSEAWDDCISPAAQRRLAGLWYEYIAVPLAKHAVAEAEMQRRNGHNVAKGSKSRRAKGASPSNRSSKRPGSPKSSKTTVLWQYGIVDLATPMLYGAALASAFVGGIFVARRMMS